MASHWQILVRAEDRQIIGEIDDELELDVRVRHLALGAWTLRVDASSRAAELLAAGSGIVFAVDGVVRLSGPVRQSSTEVDQEDGGRGVLTVSGVSDAAGVRRVIWPDYTSLIPDTGTTQSVAYQVLSGPAETVIRTIVDRSAGPSALEERRMPGLVLGTDQGRGATVTSQARMDDLHEHCYALAEVGGVGWDILQTSSSGDLELVFYEPRDLTSTARFGADLGNVASYSYQLTPPEVTDVIVGVGGEGVDRVFFRFTSRDPLWPDLVIEEFADRRDVDPDADPMDPDYVDPAEAAAQAAAERFAETAGKASVQFSPIDTNHLRAATDYDRGDLVTFEIEELGPIVDVIREMRYQRTPDAGQVITPSVGEEQERPAIYRRVQELRRDVNRLQASR